MDALAAHSTTSKQAIDSERVREGLKDVLLGPGQLCEAPRGKGRDGTGEVVGELGIDMQLLCGRAIQRPLSNPCPGTRNEKPEDAVC